MPQAIFLNLPVTDLDRARSFYSGIGFLINEAFSDDTAISVVVSETIYLMLLTHDKYAQFTDLPIGDATKQSQHLLALTQDSKEAVDALTNAALACGGSERRPAQDHGFMYGRSFTDPDGHTWEPFWMDPAATEAGPPDIAS